MLNMVRLAYHVFNIATKGVIANYNFYITPLIIIFELIVMIQKQT